ncbi:hypothetical protein TESG_02871 [Trichophyton tonsurans CBS 112818]|uniref:Uncharacterized protein n=2 Tax=Trichophyton TaxID=5550 RepID=F2PNN2_TRIEC|nr:hypothetical protein TESG_02871 [Trichophyton tonsurans CBS 112818]EGE03500.1 hypothetical protein TEQG_02530 [Trichophyton equinum CBS 127.97]
MSYVTAESLDGFLNPVGAGGIFTVSKLLIISMFPPDPRGWQAEFSTPSLKQGGKSTCLPLTALVASRATQNSRVRDKLGLGALLVGYQAAFWCLRGNRYDEPGN